MFARSYSQRARLPASSVSGTFAKAIFGQNQNGSYFNQLNESEFYSRVTGIPVSRARAGHRIFAGEAMAESPGGARFIASDTNESAHPRNRRSEVGRDSIHNDVVRQGFNFASAKRYDSAFSRHEVPEVCFRFALTKKRGRREDRMRAAPAVSCANCTEKSAHEHTGPAENTRPSLRNGLRLISCSSW